MSSPLAGVFRSKLVARYGTLIVLLLLCGYYSYATLNDQHPTDEGAARVLAG